MTIYEEMHYKEKTPDVTIRWLKEILDSCGIEVEETVPLNSSLNTKSLRVTIKGTNIGTNGKGVNEEYARASAYAEFFERFQNAILGHSLPNENIPFSIANDEKFFKIEELLKEKNAYLDFYFSERKMNNVSLDEKIKCYEKVNRYDKEDEKKYLALPFYSVRGNCVVYLPYTTYSAMYGSNGMCAGNTYEEALVQGISEIVERIVQRRIFLEKPALPDIPVNYIKKFPQIYEMYTCANSNKNYSIYLKDCSFGGMYPVVALCIVEKNTGRYGVKLGCHPNIGIAMERTFTEISQGMDIFEYSKKRSWLDFSNSGVDSTDNIANSFKVGLSQYPYQLFSKKTDYPFTETKNVENMTNSEIIKSWVSEFVPKYDVFIRNVSYTGFPSFHIIIPGLSEMQIVSDYDFRARNTRSYVAYLITHPENINTENVKYVIGVLKEYANSIYENSLSTYIPPDFVVNLPFEDLGSDIYLLAMCYLIKGDFKSAKQYISVLHRRTKSEYLNVSEESKKRINCIYYYISGMCEIGSHNEVLEYLTKFFDYDLCEFVADIFGDISQVIVKQYQNIIINHLSYFDDFRCKLASKYINVELNQMDVSNIFLS